MPYSLIPLGNGSNFLNPILINSNDIIRIGRDDNISGIITSASCSNYEYVSRNHLELVLSPNNILSMKATARQDNVVFLNKEPCEKNKSYTLQDKDIISLLGGCNFFNYQVSYKTISNTMLNNDISVLTSNNKIKDVKEAIAIKDTFRNNQKEVNDTKNGIDLIKSKLLRQYECSICYETIACAMSLNPCGDNFCYSCISDWACKHNKCPMCQIDFQLALCIPNRIVDNAIRDLLSSGEGEVEELKDWEQRLSDGIELKKKLTTTIPSTVVIPSKPTIPIVTNMTTTSSSVRPVTSSTSGVVAGNVINPWGVHATHATIARPKKRKSVAYQDMIANRTAGTFQRINDAAITTTTTARQTNSNVVDLTEDSQKYI